MPEDGQTSVFALRERVHNLSAEVHVVKLETVVNKTEIAHVKELVKNLATKEQVESLAARVTEQRNVILAVGIAIVTGFIGAVYALL